MSTIKFSSLVGIVLMAASLTSNASDVKKEERQWTEYKCSGFKTWNDCKQAARKDCNGAFDTRNHYENILIQRREFEASCKQK